MYVIRTHTRGSASAAEPPGCSSFSLPLLGGAAVALLLVPERLHSGTRPDELAPPARARFFSCCCCCCCCWWFVFVGLGAHRCCRPELGVVVVELREGRRSEEPGSIRIRATAKWSS
jgi:hypothetical protein